MKNIDRITEYIAKYGEEGTIIHTVPRSGTWIIAQKIEKKKWSIAMCKPMGNVMYNVGIVSDKNHLALWKEIVKMEIETKASEEIQARQLQNTIKNFIKTNQQYKNFIKIGEEITINEKIWD